MATPDYTVNYDDERFDQATESIDNLTQETTQAYQGMIDSTDQYYQNLQDQTQAWGDKQVEIQNQQTEFTIDQINQQKEQAHKDYIKEQAGAYVDWRKQSNEYGAEAEKMAASGLANTGYSESSQVSMYNQYQNRVATSREAYSRAVLDYDNDIKEAQLQNSAILAEIANNTLQKKLELAIDGFQYKNQLITEMTNKKVELDNMRWQRWTDTLQQINTENALKEEVRQFESTQKFTEEQNRLDRNHELKMQQIDQDFEERMQSIRQKFEADQAALDRQHDFDLSDYEYNHAMAKLQAQFAHDAAEAKKERDAAAARITAQLAADKELYEYKAQTDATYGASGGIDYSNTEYGDQNNQGNTAEIKIGNNTYKFTGTTYKEAANFLRSHGFQPGSMMTDTEWRIRKAQYDRTGTGSGDVSRFASYPAYLKAKIAHIVAGEE